MRVAARRLATCLALSAAATAITGTCGVAVAQGAARPKRRDRVHVIAARRVPGRTASLDLLDTACVSATTCYAVGQSGSRAAVVAIHSGVPSRATVFGPRGVTPTTIACAGGSCEAIGTEALPTRLPGASYPNTQQVAVTLTGGLPAGSFEPIGPVNLELDAFACPAAGSCLVLADTGFSGLGALIIPLAPGQPIIPRTVPRETLFNGLACPTTTICEALAAPSAAREDLLQIGANGNLLGSPVSFGGFSPGAIACPTATTCYAVGDYVHHPPFRAGAVAIVNGVPGKPHAAAGVSGLSRIICPTADVCEAFGYHGAGIQADARIVDLMVTIHRGLPGTPVTEPKALENASLTCPTATRCLAVGSRHPRPPYDPYVAVFAAPSAPSGPPPPAGR